MTGTAITVPYPAFVDSSGLALTGGFIYVGTSGLNAQTNPIQLYWDAALTALAAQPIRTLNGYPVNGASPATLFTASTSYSLVVRDRNAALIFSTLTTGPGAAAPIVISYPQTAAELAAGVTPTDTGKYPGDILRYGASAAGSAASNVTAINNALLSNSLVFASIAGTYSVNASLLPQSSQVFDLTGITLKSAAGVAWADAGLVDINTKSDVTILNGVIDGNKANNATGRMMGVRMLDSSTLRLVNVTARNCPGSSAAGVNGGDGFYIGGSLAPGCTNVELENCTADGCVRQGASIVKGSTIRVNGGAYINTTGSAPGAGIDIEGNSGADTLKDIAISGVNLSGNYNGLIVTTAAVNVAVTGNTFNSNRAPDLLFGDCNNVAATGNTIVSNQTIDGSAIVECTNPNGLTFVGNTVKGQYQTTDRGGIRIQKGSNVIIQGNYFTATNAAGVEIGFSTQATVISNVSVKNNWFTDCVTAGATAPVVRINANSGGAIYNTLISVTDNDIIDTRSAGNEADTGVLINAAVPAATIAGYRIERNRISGPAANYSPAQQFTGTLTGCTTSPTGTIKYTLNGDLCALDIPAISATSNTTACTITGMPQYLWPANTVTLVGECTDNGVTAISKITISTAGVITLFFGTSATFTNAGTKGVAAGGVTYRML